ncbi:MAG: membrane dipeptidase [Chitinophagaceae bacterium]|nr:membrane dipeptidase [Chitinophagaceae bacterium]
MENFRYADIHCHPNLKTFGHSFDKRTNRKHDMWFRKPPSAVTKKIHRLTGISKFSQANFSSMTKGKARIISLSLYPFEKGFFINPNVTPPLAAFLADWGIEIGYHRIRHLQKHTNYFQDLQQEYEFVLNSRQHQIIRDESYHWQLTANWQEVERVIAMENTIAVIITIEGAHVFNCGLGDFGVAPDEKEILGNIQKVKQWQYAPLFIGLAHNFNNDLCGHARSLQRLGKLVNQEKNIDAGIFKMGEKVIHALLDNNTGRSIFIDLKHMSLLARQQYLQLLKSDYSNRQIPIIVSHGSVTGLSCNGVRINNGCYNIFNTADINFFDEEIIAIAASGGLFAMQMDICIQSDLDKLKQNLPVLPGETPIQRSAKIIWNQLQHIALLLDQHGAFAWGTTAIGSDFDGSINPFPGVLTAEDFEPLAKELVVLAGNFLAQKKIGLPENKQLDAEEIIDRFMYGNTAGFLKTFF